MNAATSCAELELRCGCALFRAGKPLTRRPLVFARAEAPARSAAGLEISIWSAVASRTAEPERGGTRVLRRRERPEQERERAALPPRAGGDAIFSRRRARPQQRRAERAERSACSAAQ